MSTLPFSVFGVKFFVHFPTGSKFSFDNHITVTPVYPPPEEQKRKQTKQSTKFPPKRNCSQDWEFVLQFTYSATVFKMIPVGFTSSMPSLNDLGIYLMVSLSCYKNTPLTENSSVLWFFSETAFFEKKRKNKIILDSTMHNPKKRILPQKNFRSENLCIL